MSSENLGGIELPLTSGMEYELVVAIRSHSIAVIFGEGVRLPRTVDRRPSTVSRVAAC